MVRLFHSVQRSHKSASFWTMLIPKKYNNKKKKLSCNHLSIDFIYMNKINDMDFYKPFFLGSHIHLYNKFMIHLLAWWREIYWKEEFRLKWANKIKFIRTYNWISEMKSKQIRRSHFKLCTEMHSYGVVVWAYGKWTKTFLIHCSTSTMTKFCDVTSTMEKVLCYSWS